MKEALFEAIRAAPDDDGPRLVYADWLAEHGEPERAELIVIQCRLARGDREGAIADREAALLARHGKKWLKEVGLTSGATFARGFVERLQVSSKVFFRAAPLLAERALVRELELTRFEARDEPWSAVAGIGRLRRLLAPRITAADVRALDLHELYTLETPGHRFGDAGLSALLELRSLRRLSASGSRTITLRVRLPHALNLEAIDLTGHDLEQLSPLAEAAPALRELRVQRFVLAPPDLARAFPKLRALTVVAAMLTPTSIRELRALPLSELAVWNNTLGAEGTSAVLEAPYAATLETLDLSASKIGAQGARMIAQAYLPRLEHLRLSDDELGDEGARAIAESDLPSRLRSLRLSDNRIGDAGAEALAAVEWPVLEQIEMYSCSAKGRARKALLERFGDRLIGAR